MPDDRERVERALNVAALHVSRMQPSAGAQELQMRLQAFRRVVDSWDTVLRPTSEQVTSLVHRIDQLRGSASDQAPPRGPRTIDD